MCIGVEAYEKEHYLEAVDNFESALPLYHEALSNCYLLCEDMLVMNITDDNMSTTFQDMLDFYGLTVDMMDYYPLLMTAVKELLECRIRCHDDVARINGQVYENYLPNHFHYLQFSYYKCECAVLEGWMQGSRQVVLIACAVLLIFSDYS